MDFVLGMLGIVCLVNIFSALAWGMDREWRGLSPAPAVALAFLLLAIGLGSMFLGLHLSTR